MTLRSRLTIFYIATLGVALVFVGYAIYNRVTAILIDQVDQTLSQSAREVIKTAKLDPNGQYTLSTSYTLNPNVVIQIWNPRGGLVASTQSFNPQSGLVFPLYSIGLDYEELMFANVSVGNSRLRILSVPIEVGNELLGTLQAGTSLKLVDAAVSELLNNLLLIGVGALVLAIFFAWVGTNRALKPLTVMTETALQITSTDDLSMRIPVQGVQPDEIGKLISSFNNTLGRMENIFDMQKRFIADVGHELRTPLTVMKGNMGLLRKMGNVDEQSLSQIEDEVERMARLVEDLLVLAQAESGELPLLRKEVEVDTLLLEVFSQAKVLAGDKVTIKIDEIDQVLVCGDKDRLKQVFLNLISNAITYSPEDGIIELGINKQDGWARIYVKDHGRGIAAEDLEHIFERFYRVEKSRFRSKGGKGFGLGLSIANWIVQSHSGRIEVESKLEHGTTFSVWLPLKTGDCD